MDLSTTPGMAPPEGQTSDFDAPYNALQKGSVAAFGLSYFLATFLVALRLFQAVKLVKKIELDLSKAPNPILWLLQVRYTAIT
jgi:hypothetical protein